MNLLDNRLLPMQKYVISEKYGNVVELTLLLMCFGTLIVLSTYIFYNISCKSDAANIHLAQGLTYMSRL